MSSRPSAGVLRAGLILGVALGCLAASPGDKQQSATSSTSDISAQASPTTAVANAPAVSSLPPSPLADARILYERGEFNAALDKYLHIVDANPKSPDAYAGLIRTYIKMKNLQQASETASKALAVADSVPVHVALGELYFRQGRIGDAEAEWVKVVNSGRQDAHAYMGLARVRWAISMYKTGWNMIEMAHKLDPSDPDIRRAWMRKLSAKERIQFLKDYLAGDNDEDEETRTSMRHYLEFLEARSKDPRGACHLVSKTSSGETPLERLLIDPSHLRGYGLNVEVNGHRSKLMLDTGASGILINRSLAEKAGVTRLADIDVGGVGDKGPKSGYRALADSLKVGGLEFQNCTVEVLDKRSVVGEDGLIGADVFSSFLVDIDFPNEKLRLKELPKRPEESVAKPLKLQSDEDEDSDSEDQGATPKPSGPQDRYIAPEMKDYTRIFRFGHMLLVPTFVGDGPAKLFLLDTGALMNHITPAAAHEVTKVHGDSDTIVHGLSGSVKKVYSADKAVLQFGHLKQENQDLVAFDLTRFSDDIGTEISGTLGFVLLRMLEIKIDYRDGLVDFEFDQKRWGR